MRQLKGKVSETNKEKKIRKKENLESKDKVFSLVLPILGFLFALLVAFVYIKTQPKKVADI